MCSYPGDPLADAAYGCMAHHIKSGKMLPGLLGLDLADLGIPSDLEYMEEYCRFRHLGTSFHSSSTAGTQASPPWQIPGTSIYVLASSGWRPSCKESTKDPWKVRQETVNLICLFREGKWSER